MNQDERRFDFHGLGAALKRAREEKGWTQAYVAELVDRDSRTIMNIENKGQYPSFDLFVKLITMFDISVDLGFQPVFVFLPLCFLHLRHLLVCSDMYMCKVYQRIDQYT